jgi:hypothetical protein
MGLHHDGEVDSVWVQLEGRRTVTTGPQVPRGTRADLDEKIIGRGWTTRRLELGSLFFCTRTPHRGLPRPLAGTVADLEDAQDAAHWAPRRGR